MQTRPESSFRCRQAARQLQRGGVVVHPADGVWGFAADAFDAAAVGRILEFKQRAVARGLIVIADEPAKLRAFVAPDAGAAWKTALASWPGPETWLLPAHPDVPYWLTGGQTTIALRQPAHRLTRALCRAFGGPLVSTSANESGRPPVRSSWQARARFGAMIDDVLAGAPDTPGVASRIRNATTGAVIRGA